MNFAVNGGNTAMGTWCQERISTQGGRYSSAVKLVKWWSKRKGSNDAGIRGEVYVSELHCCLGERQ